MHARPCQCASWSSSRSGSTQPIRTACAAIQSLTQPHLMDVELRDEPWRAGPIWGENVWGNAVHRVVADGFSLEQAVDEAIARIKQILTE
jgi:hypothetical protein